MQLKSEPNYYINHDLANRYECSLSQNINMFDFIGVYFHAEHTLFEKCTDLPHLNG